MALLIHTKNSLEIRPAVAGPALIVILVCSSTHSLLFLDLGTLGGLISTNECMVQVITYAVGSVIYNLLVSPLRHIPGPKLWAISQIPHCYMQAFGNGHKRISELHHSKHGFFVRPKGMEGHNGSPQSRKCRE